MDYFRELKGLPKIGRDIRVYLDSNGYRHCNFILKFGKYNICRKIEKVLSFTVL